jgi:hypothetical protein
MVGLWGKESYWFYFIGEGSSLLYFYCATSFEVKEDIVVGLCPYVFGLKFVLIFNLI